MPGLLTLKTNLKDIKYGQDQPGGGDSRQPYIQTDINTVDTDFNRLRLTKFDDGLIRGGAIGALNSSVVDTLRIGKFFLDAPKGPLFIIKQVGLQLSNPRLEVPKNPANIAAGVPSSVLSVGTNGLLQPTRIYNLGINTLAQVPLNAFGGHIVKHGLLPIQSDANKYEAIVTANNDNLGLFSDNPSKSNRLISLKDKFQLGDRQANKSIINSNFLNQINTVLSAASAFLGGPSIPSLKINKIDTVIDDYTGGPGSVYGIGRTLIKRTSDTEDGIKINLLSQFSRDYAGYTREEAGKQINYTSDLGTGNNAISNYGDGIQNYIDDSTINASLNKNVIGAIKTYSALKAQIDKTTKSQLEYKNSSFSSPLVGEQLPSSTKKIEYKNTYGEIVTVSNKLPWRTATREVRVGSGRQDSINLTPLFTANTGADGLSVTIGGNPYTINDLVKFRIQAVDTDGFDKNNPLDPGKGVYMVFRAYLTDLSDDVSAEWSDIKYAGRGDKFYIYNGFSRKMSIGFKVAALSAQEMAPMYHKLNYLMSNLMPDYKDNLMRGPLVRMTVGNYVDSQLGILTSLNYKVSNETPWEIALNEPVTAGGTREMVLPHIIEVSLGFTPIGSQTTNENKLQEKLKPNDKDYTTTHIAQNYNGKTEKSNYITSGSILDGTLAASIVPPKTIVDRNTFDRVTPPINQNNQPAINTVA